MRLGLTITIALALLCLSVKSRAEAETPQSPRPAKAVKKPRSFDRHFFKISIGPTLIDYSEVYAIAGTQRQISEMMLTPKLAYEFLLAPPRWSAGVNAYLATLPLRSSISGIAAQFLGVNVRVGYSLPFVGGKWRMSLLGGWYYTTSFVTNNAFGFKNLAGPQFYPTIRRLVARNQSMYVYFKYSPVSSDGGISLLSLSNREIAGGGGWTYHMPGGRSFSLMVDVSNLNAQIPVLIQEIEDQVTFKTSSYSVSIGYGW